MKCALHLRRGWYCVFILALSIAAGCGGSKHKMIPVAGTITVDGTNPPASGMIVFTPVRVAEGSPFRPGSAVFDESGRFKAQTFGKADGLVPGEYRVSIECWEIPPSMTGPTAKSHIDMKYNTARTSGLELIVPSDHSGALQADFEL